MARTKNKDIASRDHQLRTILKAITWRIIATGTTAGLVYLFTGELELAIGVGVLEVTLKLAFYYLHERGWAAIPWGKVEHPLADRPVKKPLLPEDKQLIEAHLKELGYL